MLKLWLRISLWFILVGASLVMGIVYQPQVLKPLTKAGVPLNYLSRLPVIGDAIQVAITPQISVQELKRLIDNQKHNFIIIDVRNPEEYVISHIPGAVLVPLAEIENGKGITQIKSLITGKKLVTYCAVGKRSHKALDLLQETGIKGINVTGGIYAWVREVDTSMPVY